MGEEGIKKIIEESLYNVKEHLNDLLMWIQWNLAGINTRD